MRQVRSALLAGLLLGTVVSPLPAADLRDVLTDYMLTSWSRKDGLTGPVWAIAQDGDGFLWVGTDTGLVRFDGVRFLAWEQMSETPLPRVPIRSLRLAADGALWVGFGGTGGIARIQRKRARLYGTDGDNALGAITALAQDRDGTMWAGGNQGLFRLASDGWQRHGGDLGLPDAQVSYVFADVAGILWVGTGRGLFRKQPGSSEFQEVEPAEDGLRALSISRDGDGRIWTSDPRVGFRPLDTRDVAQGGMESGRGYRLLHDRDGNLWVGTIGQGLWRVRRGASGTRLVVEKTTVLSGLSSDAVRSVFEDREGNIWAGTTEGLDRLVRHRITPWTGLGIVGTLDVRREDQIWVGTSEGLVPFTRGEEGWQPDATRIDVRGVRAIRADHRGHLWVLASDGLFRMVGARLSLVPVPTAASRIDAIAAHPAGGIWAVARDGTIMHDDGTRVRLLDAVGELNNARITSAYVDRHGRLWVGFNGSRVGVLLDLGHFRSYGAQNGVGGGPHYSFHEDTAGVLWISGAEGLSRFAHGQFATVTRANGLPNGGIYAVTEDEDGFLWLATSAGLLRLARSEVDLAIASRQHQMQYRLYDTSDGLAGFPTALGERNVVRAGDGSLWFLTSRGLSLVQPRALAESRPTPHVMIETVRADDRVLAVDGAQRLPAGTEKLEIDYTAPDVTYPLKLRFRYRLEGFDADWIDAGTRRQVLYTNLPPRDYQLAVAVSTQDAQWAEANPKWEFSIAPHLYQTWWFYALCALSVVGLVWIAWQLRLRQLRRQFALVLGERVRVSRELHDTLLQSLVGVALEFDSIAKGLDASPELAKERVVNMRERVEEYIREARRSIWSLRSPALETRDLVEALRQSGERATAGRPIAFAFHVKGTPRRCGADVEHQLLRIGQEAVLNAVRHAHASRVEMTLEFSDDSVSVKVRDDGVGFSPERTIDGTTDHYGLTTMKERAQQMGGRLSIDSRPQAGTVVEVVVPVDARAQEG